MTKAERQKRRDRCKVYLRRAGNMPAAEALAAKDGFTQNGSVWIGALGEMIGDGAKLNGGTHEGRA